MAETTPPIFEQALAHLTDACKEYGVESFDPLRTPFAKLQALVGRVPHNGLLIVLGAMLGKRITEEHGAFWFPQREAPLGAALGLPDALLAIAPLDLVDEALRAGSLEQLDRSEAALRDDIAKASGEIALTEQLVPDDYRALFDPAFVYFLVVDPARVAEALAMSAGAALEQLRGALARAAVLSTAPTVRESLDAVWAVPLAHLAPDVTLADHASRGELATSRTVESFVRLYAGVASSGAADEAFWADAVFPLVHADPAQGARLLGVFGAESAAPVVPSHRARLSFVDASDLPAQLEPSEAEVALPAALVVIAKKRLAELDKLRTRAQPPLALAFRRLTEAELPHEAAAPAVADALRV